MIYSNSAGIAIKSIRVGEIVIRISKKKGGNMKKYNVTIKSTIYKIVQVEAGSKQDAVDIATEKYENGDIVLFDLCACPSIKFNAEVIRK